MELIIQLKQQHVEILHFIESIKSEIKNPNLEKNYLIEGLMELRDFLIGHLMVEDKMLYPALEKSKKKQAKTIGKKFSAEMQAISKSILKFFEKYIPMKLSNLLKNPKFKKEINLIFQSIKKRIIIEEKILFPAYEKYSKK